MNGGCYAVGPRPLAVKRERFGVIYYMDTKYGVEGWLARYDVQWGSIISPLDGQEYPVQYAADVFLPEPDCKEAWVEDIHKRTIASRGAWDTHLEQYLPLEGEWHGRVFEPLKTCADRAMERHWNPTIPIEWIRANVD